MTDKQFWGSLDKTGKCWVWPLAKDGGGYGIVYIDGTYWKAHRYAYAKRKGRIGKGRQVLHTCDNPPCCRPGHLYQGTDHDNRMDAIRRGRWVSPLRKFSPDQIVSIRERVASGERIIDLAAEQGVCHMCISRIAKGTRYRSVGGPIQQKDMRSGRKIKVSL
jgi:hypothetical protein